MATSKLTPSAVPLDATPNLRKWLDDQMRRLQPLVNSAAQRDEDETIEGDWTFTGDVTLKSAGDALLTLEADTGNTSESANPGIKFIQDGGARVAVLGLGGLPNTDALGNTFTGAPQNSFGIHYTVAGEGVSLGTNGKALLVVSPGKVTINSIGAGSAQDVFAFRDETDTADFVFRYIDNAQWSIYSEVNGGGTNWMTFRRSGDIHIPNTLYIGDGTEASPAVKFASDTDTGFYRDSANVMALSTGGTQSALWSSSTGYHVKNGGSVYIEEKAFANTDIAGRGQLWVKNTTPCQLWFTDDAGTDTQIV